MAETSIEWTDKVWNPTRGCRRISPGCGGSAREGGCYAERMAYRFSGPGQPYEGLVKLTKQGPRWTGEGRLVPEKLAEPLSWRKPARVFVDSMSDLFFEAFTSEEIAAVFGVMAACPHITFQVLTKRARRMREWFDWFRNELTEEAAAEERLEECLARVLAGYAQTELGDGSSEDEDRQFWRINDTLLKVAPPWPLPNVWLGVSVEDQKRADERIPELLTTPAAVRFLSVEPQLEAVDVARFLEEQVYCKSCLQVVEEKEHDLCPECGERGWLVTTWGEAQLERTMSGTRLDNDGEPPLHLIIQGGESGPNARPFDEAWAHSMRDQCKAAGVRYFLKQFGSNPHMRPTSVEDPVWLHDRSGGDPSEWPESLRVREMPGGAPCSS